jgi:hypothetical protein
MESPTRRPFRQRHAVPLVAGALALVYFIGQGLDQIFAVEAPPPAFHFLIASSLLRLLAFGVLLALLLISNTRRPYGIDPNEPPAAPASSRRETERESIVGADGLPYGKRRSDVPVEDVRRVVAAVRTLEGRKPDEDLPVRPDWASDVLKRTAHTDLDLLPPGEPTPDPVSFEDLPPPNETR